MRVTIPVHLIAALTKEKLKQLNQYTLFPIDVFPTKGFNRKQARDIVTLEEVHIDSEEGRHSLFYSNSIYLYFSQCYQSLILLQYHRSRLQQLQHYGC